MTAFINHTTTADDLEAQYRIQRKRANRCECGAPSDIYADDQHTPLCARCWWAIYGTEAGRCST